MSIIYDALKKAQKAFNFNPKVTLETKPKDRKGRYALYILYVLVVCIGLVVGNAIFGFLPHAEKPSSKHAKSIQPQTSPPPTPVIVTLYETTPAEGINITKKTQVSLLLNGVFSSEEEGYALINNRVVKEGDEIEGLSVKRVNLDNVELAAKDGSVIKLSINQRLP